VSIDIPYWFEGEQAQQVVDRLQAIAEAIEAATGLVAYDPQADAAFLQGGANEAPGTFDRINNFIAEELAERPEIRPTPRWAFWRR
ncbi:MAG: hypothetical protein HKN91_05780, partial [Acidimicrobiia bacterium]|nr:hypothetical protein [Acidimicrobiia bacterium]